MNIVLAGQKRLGAAVLDLLTREPGIEVIAVSAPAGDRLRHEAERRGIPVVHPLTEAVMPEFCDLIVAAHAHEFISERARLCSRFGGIGYHPSLLPLHRGRDAVRWALKMGDRVTGGTVYRLSNGIDAGDIVCQRHLLIPPGITASELWHDLLYPQAIALILDALRRLAVDPHCGTPQDPALATWEPALDVPPVHRPDLRLIGHDG